MAKKDVKLSDGIRNISFEVLSSDISVYSERIDVPVVRYDDNFEVLGIGRDARIKEIRNVNDSNIKIRGNGNCSIRIGSNSVINSRIIISGGDITIINGQIVGNNNGTNALNGEYKSVELILPKKYEDYSINANSKSGDFNIEDTILARLVASTISGDITLNDIDAIFTKLKTVSGDIKATMLESIINYRMALKTVSGSTNQNSVETVSPSILQRKHEIEVETVSGDISLIYKGKR